MKLTKERFAETGARACTDHALSMMKDAEGHKVSDMGVVVLVMASTVSVQLLMRELFSESDEIEVSNDDYSNAVERAMETDEFDKLIDGGVSGVLCGLIAVAIYRDIESKLFGEEKEDE